MPKHRVRVWVAGPRGWENGKPLWQILNKLAGKYGIARLLVMTGGAPGVDTITENICNELGVHVFACRACWPVGRYAGPVRNTVIAEEFEPDLLIALHYYKFDQMNHRGTQSAIRAAKREGIPVKVFRVSPAVALPSSVSDVAPGAKARKRAEANSGSEKGKTGKQARKR